MRCDANKTFIGIKFVKSGKMDLEDDVEVYPDFVKDVLDAAIVAIVDKLEPDRLLDIFVQRNILGEATHRKIRDIRELKDEGKPSDKKNRAIRDMIRGSPRNYVIFKEGIASTGQQELLHELESAERKLHDSLKEGHCDSTASCALLQSLKHQKLEVSTPTSKPFQELQEHLIHIYGKRKFWENPVSSEGVFLSQMYVQPSAKFVREIDDQGMLAEVKEQASSKLTYEAIFSSKTGLCENIYITGDAGKGKTTFCNQLFLHWCKAVQNIPNETVSPDDLKVLASFRFLFHIDLRDSETTYHVEDMIKEQLLSNVPMPVSISDILKTESCLIVLDGLDEWSCPDNVKKCHGINKHIPGRNTSYKNSVFLTTARSWKYDIIALKNDDRDKHIELSGIGEDSSKQLAQKILDNLDQKSKAKQLVSDFYDEVEQKELDDFLTVPVLLIQLITLWHAGKDFGQSQLQLYCSMLELMFERSEKNLPEEILKCSSTAVVTRKKLPECFSTKDNCQKYAELLHCLAKLAYKALFNKQKEEALVFRSSKLDIFGISSSDIKLCLHCGILSQCKDYGNYTGKYKKFSFLHKKVQEYLAALYLVTNDKVEDILKEVKQLCNSVETMLEMNQVWLFVAGMNPDMTRLLLEHLGHIVSADERVNTYRQTVDRSLYSNYDSLICDIQRCVSDCVLEGISNGHHYNNVCLEDFYRRNVHAVERVVFCSDMSKVKSVYIWADNIDAAKLAAITGQFEQCRSLQRLSLYDPWYSYIPDCTVTALVDNNWGSLTALYLWTESTATDKLVTAICNSISKSLMALKLSGGFKLTHKHKEQILNSLSQSHIMRQLELIKLYCTDHDGECAAQIDWSATTPLRELTLWSMSLDNLPSLPHRVEKVELHKVKLTHTHREQILHNLSQLPVIRQLELSSLYCTEHDDKCRTKIDWSAMTGLQEFTLRSMYLDSLQTLPHCVEKVELWYVTLPVTSLRDFAGGLSQTKRKVTIKLFGVTFTKSTEECGGDLESFLQSCEWLKLTLYEYDDNEWSIHFHTNSQ